MDLDLTPSLTFENVVFKNAPWGTLPGMADAQRVEVELALLPLVKKQIQVKRLILREPSFSVESDSSGRCNLSFQGTDKAPAEGKRQVPALSLGEVEIEKGVFTYKDEMTGKRFSVRIHRLSARTPKRGGPIDLDMRGSFGSRPFGLKGWVGPLASLMTPEEPWRINVRATAFGAELHLSGSVRSFKSAEGLVLRVQAAGESFKKIAEVFGGGSMPELGPFRVRCDLWGSRSKTYHLSNLKFSTRAGNGAGDLNVTLGGSRPDLRGRLSWQKLDVAALLSKRDAHEKGRKIFSSNPFPIEGLQKLTGELELNIDRLILPNIVLEALKTRLRAKDRHIVAEPLRFKSGGGQAEGTLELEKKGDGVRVTAQARAERVDLSLLLKERKAQGSAEAEIDVSAQGASLAALMGSLEGRALLSVRGFRVENKYLKLLGSDFITSLMEIFAPPSKETNATEINCMVAGFLIARGLAQATALVADTNEMIAMGRGNVDLKEERLDLSISSRPKKGVAGLTLSVGQLARAFRVGGPLADPTLSIDPLHTALTIGKAVGGVFLIGPAGAALAFAGQTADEEDICLAAMEAARRKGNASEEKTPEKKGNESQHENRGTGPSLQSVGEGTGSFFKWFSSRPVTAVDIYGGGP